MYGGFLTPPDDDGAHFGVLFWHKDGFSTACGHGSIALGVWAVQTGRVSAPDTGTTDVIIDVPSGRVTARVHTDRGRVTGADFVNVPGYVLATRIPVTTSRATLPVDISYGGAVYAQVDLAATDLTVTPGHSGELIALGREITAALRDSPHARHPSDERLSGIYGTILYEHLSTDGPGSLTQRNATVFADGQLDRSPCGSGTYARVATLADTGALTVDGVLTHRCIVGAEFTARIRAHTTVDGRPAVTPEVTGMAYRVGEHISTVDPDDPLTPGFVLR